MLPVRVPVTTCVTGVSCVTIGVYTVVAGTAVYCGGAGWLIVTGVIATTVGVVAPTGSRRPSRLPLISLKKMLPSGSGLDCVICLLPVLLGTCHIVKMFCVGSRRNMLPLYGSEYQKLPFDRKPKSGPTPLGGPHEAGAVGGCQKFQVSVAPGISCPIRLPHDSTNHTLWSEATVMP